MFCVPDVAHEPTLPGTELNGPIVVVRNIFKKSLFTRDNIAIKRYFDKK